MQTFQQFVCTRNLEIFIQKSCVDHILDRRAEQKCKNQNSGLHFNPGLALIGFEQPAPQVCSTLYNPDM